MNYLSTALLAYTEMGLLLLVAYVMLRGLRRAMQQRVDPGGMIRVGRGLFAMALIAPLAGHWLISLPGRSAGGAAGNSQATVDELAALLRGLSGLLSSPLGADAGSTVDTWFGGLDPLWVRNGTWAIAVLLLAGLSLAAFRAALRVRHLRSMIRSAVPYRRLGKVAILVSDRASVPFSTAIFGLAHVVLPVGLLRDPLLLRVTVRHELQHYRRRDPLWSVAFELFRVAYFWNPAVYGWTRELSDLQELACDEAVIRRGVPASDYGNCLLRVAEMAVARRVVASTTMATISDRGAHLRRRIDMLFRDPSQSDSRRWAMGLTVMCSLMLLLVATVAAANWPNAGAAKDTETAAAAHDHANCDPSNCEASNCDRSNCDPSNCAADRQEPLEVALPDLEFRSSYGETVRLADLQGEVVLVDFWASWCKFCQAEVTQMKALHERMAGEDFRMVGVSLSKTSEATREFVEEHDVRWPQMHAEGGWKSEAGIAFGVKAVPSRYLIDRAGQVTLLPRGNPERLVEMILGAIDDKPVLSAAR